MTKSAAPLLSLDPRGTFAGIMVASYWKGVNYLRLRVVPSNPNTSAQQAIRTVMTNGVSNWRHGGITAGDQTDWNSYAAGKRESGINRFIRAYVAVNYDGTTQEVITPEVIPDPA